MVKLRICILKIKLENNLVVFIRILAYISVVNIVHDHKKVFTSC